MRFVARNIAMLRQRRLPVTAGTVYLAHFAGGAGAVAILSAPDNSDAALVIANADSTGRTKRERLIKANPFLEHFTVADLKAGRTVRCAVQTFVSPRPTQNREDASLNVKAVLRCTLHPHFQWVSRQVREPRVREDDRPELNTPG